MEKILYLHPKIETVMLTISFILSLFYGFRSVKKTEESISNDSERKNYLVLRPGEQNHGGVYEKCKEVIKRESSSIQLNTPAIIAVNRDYIVSIASRANRDVDNGEYDSAITKARTLLEEVFCHAIERKGETPSNSGEIGRLYNQVKTLYNMHQARDMDVRINMLLSGLEKILSAITQMRNESGDSHGVGANRIRISEHHARLFVNSAITMADFILSVEKNSQEE